MMPSLTISVPYSTASHNKAISKEKEIADILIGMKEMTWSLFPNYMILYIESSKDFTKDFRTDKFNKITKNLAAFYTLGTIQK
jgi:hypothetical protein